MAATAKDAERELESILRAGVEQHVFPGAVAALGQLSSDLRAPAEPRASTSATSAQACFGALEPGGPGVTPSTLYDLASLTKPVIATLALRSCQRGWIDLHDPVARWLPELEDTLGGSASLALLLSHRAGLSPWGSLYKEVALTFGSPQMQARMLREAAIRSAPAPSVPGSVYSDLGYMLAGAALSRALGAPLDVLVKREVTEPLGVAGELFYMASLSDVEKQALLPRVAPTEQCAFRGRVVRAEVHDENCAAFGGICGHAGLFGTARSVLRFGLALLDALAGRSTWLDQALLRWALQPREGGGHVVGWDTKSREGSSAGAHFSERSFGHLGFTGTSLWCDPVRARCAVLLSNRVHPTRDNIAIREFRPRFHDLCAELVLEA